MKIIFWNTEIITDHFFFVSYYQKKKEVSCQQPSSL